MKEGASGGEGHTCQLVSILVAIGAAAVGGCFVRDHRGRGCVGFVSLPLRPLATVNISISRRLRGIEHGLAKHCYGCVVLLCQLREGKSVTLQRTPKLIAGSHAEALGGSIQPNIHQLYAVLLG